MLAYLARYTHRVAISNSCIRAIENGTVTFACKDCRRDGPARYGSMILDAHEFIRRFLIHVLPKASTASDTMASSLMVIAPPTSSVPVNGLAHCQKQDPTMGPRTARINAKGDASVPAAAVP